MALIVNTDQLINDARCIDKCIPDGEKMSVLLSVLYQLQQNGTGGSTGATGNFPTQGIVNPTTAPLFPSLSAVYTNLVTGVVYYWNVTTQAWTIAPSTLLGAYIEFIAIPSYLGAANAATPAANTVYLRRMIVPYNTLINSLTFNLGVGVAGGLSGFSLYSRDGNTRLLDTGPIISTVAAQGNITVALPATEIPAGEYISAWNTNSLTIQLLCVGAGNVTSDGTQNAGHNILLGSAANAAVAGQNPATLGVLSAVNGLKTPVASWQY